LNHDEGEHRAELERRAERAREGLLRSVAELDLRRREALDWRAWLEKKRRVVAVVTCMAALGAGLAGWLAAHRSAAARRHRWRDRWLLWQDGWRRPDRALRVRRAASAHDAARALLFALLAAAASLGVPRAFARLAPAARTGHRAP